MSERSFQIRVCQNPECGLRYPVLSGQRSGQRCPACLAATRIVVESNIPEENENHPKRYARAGRYEVLLDNIRSAWNVGSILRSADGFGFQHAYLCGITPDPSNSGVRKTSLGAERSIPWSTHKNAVELASHLKADGYYLLALETGKDAIPLGQYDPILASGWPTLLIVGGEVTGVDPGLLTLANLIVCLPMRGMKGSLNVAVAFGAAACHLAAISDH